jgi:tetratricopeptide (TPR) repeat protein
MMTYPGNQSLPSDVQQRIRSTFEHTLGLAEKGSNQEALLGCDFVLRMDPLFEPARRLQERLESTQGPLAVDDLRRLDAAPQSQAPSPPSSSASSGSSAGPTAASAKPPAPAHTAVLEAPESLWGDLDGLASELPELPEPHQAGLRAEFEALLGERRFQELQGRARQEAATVTGDLELQRLVSLAQERLEAGPYVSKFLLSAREALRAGRPADSQRLVEKARALDPTHPGIAELSSPPAAQPPTEAFAIPSPAGPGSFGMGAERSLAPAPEMQTQPISRVAATPAFALQEAPPPSAASGDSESERRIEQLVAEGQKALDAGDPQAAIDVWSRIFLIDIDHQEAARLIESARRMKAERDRQVEETFHDGLARLEANDAEGARHAFQHVLELQPGHLPSREYLQQLDDGRPPAAIAGRRPGGKSSALPPGTGADALAARTSSAAAADALPAPPIPPLPPHLAAGAAHLPPDAELKEEILVPPDLGARAPAAVAASAATRQAGAPGAARPAGRARRMFLVVGSAVLLLVLAVGWFLYQKREQWFPNSRTEEPAQAPGPNPIPRAVKLHDAGRATIALTQLRHVPPGDPHYKEAQALIAKWQEEPAQGTPGVAGGAGTPPEGAGGAAGQAGAAPGASGLAGAAGAVGSTQGVAVNPEVERRASLLEEARAAYQQGTYLLAAERFEAADRLRKLDAGDAAQLNQAKQRLVPLQRQVAMFRGHDWEYALPDLWRLHESDPANRDVTRMLVDSYYDLGVRDLQHTDPGKAAEKFKEARKLAPDDAGVNRQLLFAQTYLERGSDLLYRIYVKYLPIR